MELLYLDFGIQQLFYVLIFAKNDEKNKKRVVDCWLIVIFWKKIYSYFVVQ